jgi:hypothetical protein
VTTDRALKNCNGSGEQERANPPGHAQGGRVHSARVNECDWTRVDECVLLSHISMGRDRARIRAS